MRRQIIGSLFPLAVACVAWPKAAADVLFVCRYGSVKSPIARELTRRRAAERGMTITARSRGITPENHMTPELRAALARDGVDVAREPLRALAAADVARADIIIAFDPLPSQFDGEAARDWTDTPSMTADYGAARAILLTRIEALLKEITARRGAPGRAESL